MQAAPDPYALARLMAADMVDTTLPDPNLNSLMRAVDRYSRAYAGATPDRPDRTVRILALLQIAETVLSILAIMGALPDPAMSNGLTPTRAKIVAFIGRRIAATQVSPTYREIAAEFKYASTGALSKQIERLIKDGYLAKGAGRRAITVTAKGESIR